MSKQEIAAVEATEVEAVELTAAELEDAAGGAEASCTVKVSSSGEKSIECTVKGTF